MKKQIISGVFALALLTTAGYGVNKSMKSNANLSGIALSNVEALASGESGSSRPYQSQGYCTPWRLKSMCSSSGAYSCTKDC